MEREEQLLRQAAVWLPLLAEQFDLDLAETTITVSAVRAGGASDQLATVKLSETIDGLRQWLAARDCFQTDRAAS